jgi:transposase-like protein
MPSQTTDPTMERARLVAAHLDGLYSVTEIAARFGVSRPTVYKWITRYREGDPEALMDRSRARHEQHHRTCPEAERLIVAARRAHPCGVRASCSRTSPSGTQASHGPRPARAPGS